MNRTPLTIGPAGWLGIALVLLLAVLLRGGLVFESIREAQQRERNRETPLPRAAWQVQGVDLDAEQVIVEIRDTGLFAAQAPLSRHVERTAHISPGFPWLIAWLEMTGLDLALVWPWLNVAQGTLTVLCVMLIVHRAFRSLSAALASGLLAALHPFWILNTAETTDGVLATFLVALALALGVRAADVGGHVASLAYGLALAALALVRAELLPFALAALLWFVFRCRNLPQGWLFASLAMLGFGNGLGPWTVRNYQVFGELVPIVDSAYLHLYLGNCDGADGGPRPHAHDLSEANRDELRAIDNQAERYAALGRITYGWIGTHPSQVLAIRFRSAFKFLIGDDRWIAIQMIGGEQWTSPFPFGLGPWVETACMASLWMLLILASIGWRISHAQAPYYRPLMLAFVLIPLPYVVSHAETLVGPRLPWDAVLICFAGYALGGWRRPSS